mmetsp:Transcript_1775/g.3948  ORF Transcript_1775/g.3948 Transcript_1775/m.3948 type:complete len:223 (-) Transcript_1775:1127-1795(-)
MARITILAKISVSRVIVANMKPRIIAKFMRWTLLLPMLLPMRKLASRASATTAIAARKVTAVIAARREEVIQRDAQIIPTGIRPGWTRSYRRSAAGRNNNNNRHHPGHHPGHHSPKRIIAKSPVGVRPVAPTAVTPTAMEDVIMARRSKRTSSPEARRATTTPRRRRQASVPRRRVPRRRVPIPKNFRVMPAKVVTIDHRAISIISSISSCRDIVHNEPTTG